MFSFKLIFVGKRFLHKGKFVRAVGETDTGNVKLDNGEWASHTDLHPIDGQTVGFRIFPLPETLAAAA
jgi:hypothetical protein